ncbi:MAG: HNH endonuclease signature motif containing protein, partial [Acidimicrobiales bacterium]
DTAWVERVVFDGPSRVIDVGETRRLFTGATRRAVLVRDRECFHELCDENAEHCQVDHIQPWSTGGPTTTANGRASCAHHNRERHRRRERPPP